MAKSTDKAFTPALVVRRLQPGQFAEVDFGLRQGRVVTCRFVASGPLLVDAHVHWSDDEVHVFGREITSEGDMTFEAPFDGVFSFLWAHAGDHAETVTLEAAFGGAADFVLWSPEGLSLTAGRRKLSEMGPEAQRAAKEAAAHRSGSEGTPPDPLAPPR